MPRVNITTAHGEQLALEVPVGMSLMQAAVTAGVSGIVGECGGSAMCATCHVYVDEIFAARLPAVSAVESEMLTCTVAERLANSRLSCQIKMTADLDGLAVLLPEQQQ
jgi:ferredoxin, 2Fe-2S